MGAGGGGFLLMIVKIKKAQLFLKRNNYNFTSIKFSENGSKIIQDNFSH